MIARSSLFLLVFATLVKSTLAFAVGSSQIAFLRCKPPSSSQLFIFGKMFETEGSLGKGITVGKVQVALTAKDRSKRSIFGLMEEGSRVTGDSNAQLAGMANDICLALLRKSDDWTAACSTSKWFGQNDAGKAEALCNDWANREASKFEKEYVPESGTTGGGPTTVVVSIIIEILGDATKFDGAGYSLSGTREVLSSIASNALVDSGESVNAVEAFWTPSERDEVLTVQDLVVDFPELISF